VSPTAALTQVVNVVSTILDNTRELVICLNNLKNKSYYIILMKLYFYHGFQFLFLYFIFYLLSLIIYFF